MLATAFNSLTDLPLSYRCFSLFFAECLFSLLPTDKSVQQVLLVIPDLTLVGIEDGLNKINAGEKQIISRKEIMKRGPNTFA